ncbi:arachidonate 8S-lipoxygenase-like [Oryzias latipes]|uniref:arachidonate 8S-lipoxygenase-like n=1 Tax=Oryzias latipes TaxID=8090 RepID=UPI000CE230D6|nr:arachidonate 8S-lipoxygenase-like [Oryzias latipes]
MIKLEKGWMSSTDWLPGKVEVETPSGKVYRFPIYHWISNGNINLFREGKAVLDFKETDEKLRTDRKEELREQQSIYCWDVYKGGIPECVKENSIRSLPHDDRSTIASIISTGIKDFNIIYEQFIGYLKGKRTWTSFEDIEDFYKLVVTPTTVLENWRKDSFFGYQYLNGINPMVIKRITSLPENFPVIIQNPAVSLNSEMEKGNIFLCDYKILDGVETNTINDKKQYLAAPLVLLHQTEEGMMMPIAIQLKQKPGEDNPIFLPSDSELDWLLAKLYVRSADFNLHELNYHLLRTHLLAEVFAVALKRNLPRVHPVFKILIRHTHDTLQINVLARESLISDGGLFSQFTASGGNGMDTILQRSLSNLTYTSLCIPDDIKERGLEDVKNFHYRDDGLELWDIMHSFVTETLSYYYKDDSDVENDIELQEWIQEIFEHGFLSKTGTGIPQKFNTVDELVKFVTMVMFTCSVQHAAINSGQNDYYGLMLNGPSTMQKPPPTKKGEATEASIMEALPDTQTTSRIMGVVGLLSKAPSDGKFLLDFHEEYFTEEGPCSEIQKFQEKLRALSKKIEDRNKDLPLPYKYLDPKSVECSVDI